MLYSIFMIDTLSFFETMNQEEMKKAEIEFAMQEAQCCRTDKDDYITNSVKVKLFSLLQYVDFYYFSQ